MTIESNSRVIPLHLLDAVKLKLARVNKRAAKIGVEPFALVVGAPYLRTVARTHTFDGMVLESYKQEVVSISVTGEPIKVAGHELVGRVDFEGEMVLVNTRPGGEMPVSFRTTTPLCQHCNSKRKRSAVFVFKRDGGEHIQVGRSCLEDYLGHSADKALWAAREWSGVMGDIDDEIERGAGRGPAMIEPALVLAAAACSIRELGFVSRAKAEESAESGNPVCTTSDDVSDLLFNPKVRAKRAPNDDDTATAALVIAWTLETLGAKEQLSDFEYNALELVKAPAVALRRIGLLTALVNSYNRSLQSAIEREAAVNAFVGTVGERRDFDAVYSGVVVIDTQFGALYIGRFQSDAGLLVYKGGSPFWSNNMQPGTAVKFKATVKAHDDYKGTKQTLVARCKLAVAA